MEATVVPIDSASASFRVFFPLKGKEVSLTIHGVSSDPDSMSLAEAKIECDRETRLLFCGFEEVLQDRLNRSNSIESLCIEIKDILDRILQAGPATTVPPAPFYARVCSEIQEIGWENVVHLGDEFTKLHLRAFDSRDREHILRMVLPFEYPALEPKVSCEFPNSWRLKWAAHAGLKTALSQFRQAVESYQDFWDTMEDVDKKAWVIEPLHPSRADCFRRIALGGHCSLLMTVDPLFPRAVPECRFFGSDAIVAPLRKKLNDNARKWNLDKYPVDNFEALLELSFPRPQASTGEDLSADCGICYTYRLVDEIGFGGGKVPDRVCDNLNCGRPFHTECLVEWLRSLTTTRQSFNVLFGSCPYCSHPLAVRGLPTGLATS